MFKWEIWECLNFNSLLRCVLGLSSCKRSAAAWLCRMSRRQLQISLQYCVYCRTALANLWKWFPHRRLQAQSLQSKSWTPNTSCWSESSTTGAWRATGRCRGRSIKPTPLSSARAAWKCWRTTSGMRAWPDCGILPLYHFSPVFRLVTTQRGPHFCVGIIFIF